MPTLLDYRLNLVRAIAVLSGLYLTYWWIESVRWNHDKLHSAVYLSALAIFVPMTFKAWRGSTWAGVAAALCSLTLVIPFTSFDRFLLAMALWDSQRGAIVYISSTAIASITWVLLPVVTHRLTLSSTRTQAQAPGPVSFIR